MTLSSSGTFSVAWGRRVTSGSPGYGVVTPSATANTLGAARTILPVLSVGLGLTHIFLQTGGVFGVETLSVTVTGTFNDGTTASVTKTFTATGAGYTFVTSDFYSLTKDGCYLASISFACQSTIASSTANCAWFYAGAF